jgi:hypothetical protein
MLVSNKSVKVNEREEYEVVDGDTGEIYTRGTWHQCWRFIDRLPSYCARTEGSTIYLSELWI